MRILIVSIVTGACMTLLWGGCTKDNVEQLQGAPVTCDTVDQHFADILPIIQANCYSCHGHTDNTFSGGLDLQGADTAQGHAALAGWAFMLSGLLNHDDGYEFMPYDRPKLDDCDINKVVDWAQHPGE
jgi:hypothetical protein